MTKTLLSRLDKKYGRYAVPHLTLFLIVGQVVAYIANTTPIAAGRTPMLETIQLNPDKVMAGEWWRVLLFMFDPPFSSSPLMAFFFWYFFYMLGSTLEIVWGNFRYNVYLFIGYLASVVMVFVTWYFGNTVGQVASNGFLFGSVFLAFARLYPDFQIMLFFVFPIKIRWLAILTWLQYAATMLFAATWLEKAMVVSAVLNYLMFFGKDIVRDLRYGHRGMKFQAMRLQGKGLKDHPQIVHTCGVCGITSEDSPRTQFRYCSQCGGDVCYCPEHLHNHEHVVPQPV